MDKKMDELIKYNGRCKALTMALVLAITAKTEANSQRAVLAAGFFAGRMQPLQVAQCQTEAKRILKSAYN